MILKRININKLLSIVLVLIMIISMIPVSAFAEGENGDAKISLNVHDDAPTLDVSGLGGSYIVNVPRSGHIDYSFGADDGDGRSIVFSRANVPEVVYEGEYDSDTNSYVFEIDGAKVVLRADGDFTYDGKINPEAAAALGGEEIAYNFIVTDSDGDSVTRTATIKFIYTSPTIDVSGADNILYEANLPDGSDPDYDASNGGRGEFNLDLHGEDGVLTVGDKTYNLTNNQGSDFSVYPDIFDSENIIGTVDGVAVAVIGINQNGEDGDWTVAYRYKLTAPLQHEKPDNDGEINVLLPVSVADSTGGDNASAEVSIKVIDDEPILDIADTELSTTATSKSVNSHVDFEYGADGAHDTASLTVNNVSGTVVAGGTEFMIEGVGKVLLKNGGDFTFTAENGVTGQQTLTFVVTDGDGDTDQAGVKITVLETPPTLSPAVGSDTIILDEGALAEGTKAHSEHGTEQNGSINVDLHGEDGTTRLSFDDQAVTMEIINGTVSISGNTKITINNAEVTFVAPVAQNADGSWTLSYQSVLTGNVRHSDTANSGADDSFTDNINILVTDEDGQTANGTVSVTVHDDAPVISGFTAGSGESPVVKPGESINGKLDFVYGADAGETKSIAFEGATTADGKIFSFTNGSKLALDDSGNYTFTMGDEASGDQILKLTVTDSDGDNTTANLTIQLGQASKVSSMTTERKTPKGGFSLLSNGSQTGNNSDLSADTEMTNTQHEMDEGALDNGTGDHVEHGTGGSGSFKVDLHGNNGFIQVGTLRFTVEEGESFTVPSDSVIDQDGVSVTITDITQEADGKWLVSYNYALTGAQTHPDPNASGADDTVTVEIDISAGTTPDDSDEDGDDDTKDPDEPGDDSRDKNDSEDTDNSKDKDDSKTVDRSKNANSNKAASNSKTANRSKAAATSRSKAAAANRSKTSVAKNAKTDDTSSLSMWMILLLTSGAAAGILVVNRKKKS